MSHQEQHPKTEHSFGLELPLLCYFRFVFGFKKEITNIAEVKTLTTKPRMDGIWDKQLLVKYSHFKFRAK